MPKKFTTPKNSREKMLEILQEKCGRKDLNFGCEVELQGDKIHRCGSDDIHRTKSGEFKIKKFYYGKIVYFKIKKILGHPLTLSDVLAAVGNKFGEYEMGVRVWGNGTAHIKLDEYDHSDVIIWNLSKNLLRDQSTETIRAIYKILILKK